MDQVNCETGVWSCEYLDVPEDAQQCGIVEDTYFDPGAVLWLVICGGLVGAIMAFGIGANDAANSWGTTVGSGAMPLRLACLIGGAMEVLGATALGAGVSKTIKGTSDATEPQCWACGYCDSSMALYMLGMFCSLLSAAIFLLLVTFTKMPVSTTHAIVGAVVGMTVAGTDWDCLNWAFEGGLTGIIASWILSPVMSGAIAVGTYWATLHVIVEPKFGLAEHQDIIVRVAMYVMFPLQTSVMAYLILLKSPMTKHMASGLMVTLTCVAAALTLLAVQLFLAPRFDAVSRQLEDTGGRDSDKEAMLSGKQRSDTYQSGALGESSIATAAIEESASPASEAIGVQMVKVTYDSIGTEEGGQGSGGGADGGEGSRSPSPQKSSGEAAGGGGSSAEPAKQLAPAEPASGAPPAVKFRFGSEKDRLRETGNRDPRITMLFKYLLPCVAALESFAHGANDTANATGAFSAIWSAYDNGQTSCDVRRTPVWIMFVAGLFVFLGMNTFGARVIETIGKGISHNLDYHMGWCIEFASTSTVVVATLLQYPVSTTHCQVGAVVFVGAAASRGQAVDLQLMSKIVITWIITLPFAGTLSAVLLLMFKSSVMT